MQCIAFCLKMQSGTEAQANATHQLLVLWEVQDDIVGMCFDTTSSNMESQSGALCSTGKLLGWNLVHLACRHHVHELIIGRVFSALFGSSKGPNIPLFEHFQRLWSMIDQQNFKPLGVPVDSCLDEPQVQELRNETIVFPKAFYCQTQDICHERIIARWLSSVCF